MRWIVFSKGLSCVFVVRHCYGSSVDVKVASQEIEKRDNKEGVTSA